MFSWHQHSLRLVRSSLPPTNNSLTFNSTHLYSLLPSKCSIYMTNVMWWGEMRKARLTLKGGTQSSLAFVKYKSLYRSVTMTSKPSRDPLFGLIGCTCTTKDSTKLIFHLESLFDRLRNVPFSFKGLGSRVVYLNNGVKENFKLLLHTNNRILRHIYVNPSHTRALSVCEACTTCRTLFLPLSCWDGIVNYLG